MRKTKIVCSIGPASESEEVLRGLCLAGMNVARLNFSHGTYEEHQRRINAIKKVRKELNLPVAIMLDTKGPEFRIKTFANGKIFLNNGDLFTFTVDDVIGDENRVSVTYNNLNEELKINQDALAYRLNIPQQSVSQRLLGKTEWTLREIIDVFEFLGVENVWEL